MIPIIDLLIAIN